MCHPDVPLNKSDLECPLLGQCLEHPVLQVLTLHYPAALTPQRRKCSDKACVHHRASQFVGMMDIDSLFHALESCPNREESYSALSSMMPPLESTLPTNSAFNPSDLAHNEAMNQG